MRKIYKSKILLLMLATLSLVSFMPPVNAEDIPSGVTVGPPVAEYKIEAGTSDRGIVRINDYAPQPIRLYPQVMDFTAKNETGEPAFIEPDPNRKFALSEWIKFSPEPIDLAVGQLKEIPYQIVVPADAEPGGHYGVIFFSTKNPAEANEGEAKVFANMKVGQLILVNVPGDVQEKGAIASFKTTLFNMMPNIHLKKDGKWNLSWDWKIKFITRINNTGNVHFKPEGKIQVSNLWGQKKAELAVNEVKGNVLPDSTRRWENDWQPKWYNIGLYKAVFDLKYGETVQTLSDSLWFVVIPWWLIAVVVVLIFYTLYKLRKRKKRQKNL